MNAPKKSKAKSEANYPEVRGYKFKPWKIALIVVAVGAIVLGFFLARGSSDGDRPLGDSASATGGLGAPPGTETAANVKKGFGVEIDTNKGDIRIDPELTGSGSAEGTWSPALLRGGLSFFVAFCLAFAFRQFMRVALLFIGVWAASLFFLNHLGWVDIHWDLIEQQFDNLGTKVSQQFESAKAFVTGSLPSAGMAGLGLFTGFRKG